MFSHRWIDMCQRHGLKVEIDRDPWGEGLPADRHRGDPGAPIPATEIKAVLATHNETATGVVRTSPPCAARWTRPGTRAAVRRWGQSRSASMPFRVRRMGRRRRRDRQQKGFMLPAGLAIVGFQPKALAAVETAGLPRTFFDMRDMAKAYAANGYPYTPAVGLLNGLKRDLRDAAGRGAGQCLRPPRAHRRAASARPSRPGA
jgi:alanine-glyoxylate transaminase / serine-glyoxylate transaminase / serine-pyruvate transaminase